MNHFMNYYVQSHIHRWIVKERKHSPSMAFCLDECMWVRAVLFPTLYTMPSAAPQNVSVCASSLSGLVKDYPICAAGRENTVSSLFFPLHMLVVMYQ